MSGERRLLDLGAYAGIPIISAGQYLNQLATQRGGEANVLVTEP